jgi:Recombinase zinc beta ribbon domain
VQKVIGRRSRPTGPKRKPYLYRGVFRCGECGCFITTETQKGHNYLRCTKRVRKDCSQPYLREESVAQQIADYLLRCSLPDSWADAIIGELETERTSGTASRRECLKSLRSRIGDADAKLERLMQAYLDKTLSLDEYREVKNRIIEEKHKLKEELNVAEENRGDWFEPAISFVKAAKQAGFLTSNASNEQRLDFFKKIGSNPTISNRHLSIVPRGPWQLVVDQGPFAQHNAAPAIASVRRKGRCDWIWVDVGGWILSAGPGWFSLLGRLKPKWHGPSKSAGFGGAVGTAGFGLGGDSNRASSGISDASIPPRIAGWVP